MDTDTIDRQLRAALGGSATPPLALDGDPLASVRRRVDRRRRRRHVTIAAVAAVAVVVAGLTSVTLVDRATTDDDRRIQVTGPDGQHSRAIVAEGDGIQGYPPPPFEIAGDAAVVWTGDELVVWSGAGAALDPYTGRWRVLPPSPLPDFDQAPVGAMTDAGVVLARGTSAAVWDPAANSWRRVDGAPGPIEDLVSNGRAVFSFSAKAVLDVGTGRWKRLPEPPVRLARAVAVWTGHELVVLGGPGTPFATATAVAYDPAKDSWRQLPAPPARLRAEALAADWDGRRVVVVNYDMAAATYDPLANTWAELPPVPARFGEWHPALRSSRGLTAAFMASTVAVLSGDDRWVPVPYGEIQFGQVATTRPAAGAGGGDGTLFVWSPAKADGATTVTALDLNRLSQATVAPVTEPRNLRMFGDASGWVETRVGDVAHLWHTTDGGDHWAAVPLPTAGRWFDSFFLDGERAWLAEAADPAVENPHSFRLHRTVDGGRSWETVDATGNAPRPQFVDGQAGWAFEPVFAAGPKGATVHRTADGGRTWRVVAHYGLPDDAGLPQNLSVDGGCDKTTAGFSDASTAWITGGGYACSNGPSLLGTRDGGQTWHGVALPLPPGADRNSTVLDAPVFDTPDHGSVVVRYQKDRHEVGGLYVTGDGGRSWDFRPLPAVAQIVDFTGGGVGWLLTSPPDSGQPDRAPSRLYRTGDGGRTWTAVESGVDTSQFWRIDFVSASAGFAVVDGQRFVTLLRTSDGGRTWSRLEVPGS